MSILYIGVVLGVMQAGVAELAKGAGLKILFLVIRGFESLLPHLLSKRCGSMVPGIRGPISVKYYVF